ncbi:DUF692 domain-containing protein [Halomonas elongata]|uniref:DUF692 domain-containing protein n=1 Tax=Halomonas elongata (strain ATCC 33173 / DSM 2581 / NBRC 15536 / NCIMB 2198 / 1H9) TaxID=768066 RepID=E1V7V0_HALED|nr:DUF692 domain-containing protein [Halomonas elongata]WBF17282.1 DUF692 domain-containing protein [Halomonas elongata]WPU46118.1 DUF692 domain-containing protein [Halomonas elongata DSM 2581]CBV43538.1 UPF0276 family protein [Halomonas elongata DSM 2581]
MSMDVTGLPWAAQGIGLKHQHVAELLAQRADVDFLELHAENHMSAGGPFRDDLAAIAERYPLSVHGVGLSLGSAEPLDTAHLRRLVRLVDELRPALVSEHLAWSRLQGDCYNDLLPLPLTEESLAVVVRHVDETQQALGRRLLVENPSLYVHLDNTLEEADFLAELVDRTGCGLLLDINNAYISAHNLGRDLDAYLTALPLSAVGEFHLAGHHLDTDVTPPLRIDDHGSPVSDAVWQRYAQLSRWLPQVPTLIEWDARIPALSRWLEEVDLARFHHSAHRVPAATAEGGS